MIKTDAVATMFNFAMESSKPEIGQRNEEKQANNALQTTGELLGHFPSKRGFLFRIKTFQTNDTVTPNRCNVQVNNDHFRNVWALKLFQSSENWIISA